MKKMRILAMLLALLLTMGTVVTAATTETDSLLENNKARIEVLPNDDVTKEITIAYGTIKKDGQDVPCEDKITVTVKSDALVVGEQVLILMCKPKADETKDPDVADGNVYFIDQKEVIKSGEITFDVYPSYMRDSIIYISGVTDGLLKAVIVDGLVIGDLDGDGLVNVIDLVQLVQYILDEEYIADADLEEDGDVNVLDLVEIVQIILES